MLPTLELDINGQGVLADLLRIRDELGTLVYNQSVEIADSFTMQITDYPPETEGNRPPSPYYSRGVGYIRRGGTVNPLSEQFGDNVVSRVTRSSNEVTIRFTLWPSYSHWLVGSNTQAQLHALRGWKTIRTVLRGMNINADETTNAQVPATMAMRRCVNDLLGTLKKYT